MRDSILDEPFFRSCDDSVEMKLYLAVDYAADTFHQASRFIVLLANADDFLPLHAGWYGKG